MDEVAADVHEGTAAVLDVVGDAGRVGVEVAEKADNRAEFSDAAFGEQFADPEPLGIAANHEGFADFDPGTRPDVKKRFGFGGGKAEGLFAENVLAGFSGLDSPGTWR
jgi:hypothetical protein